MTENRNQELESARQEVRREMERIGDKIPLKARQLVEDAVVKIKVDHVQPKVALGLSPEILEKGYRYAYNLFQAGKYQEALRVFEWLRDMDIANPRYNFAIAACYHYSKDYLDAAANYIVCNYWDALDPIPCFHLYDCFMKAGYPLSALSALHETLILAGDNPQYAALKNKAQIELKNLEEYLKIHLPEMLKIAA
jgi:type III secretion system low calcium response chaperone LcrH/SycD